MNLTIGILTYNSPKTLKNTLESYRINGLLDATDDILCIIQPSDKQIEEEAICNEYGIKPLVQTTNSKMAGGIKKIWEHAKYEFVLFLECDFCLSASKDKTKEVLQHSLDLINNNTADIVRLRSLKMPGHQIQDNLYKERIATENPFDTLDLSRQLYLVAHYLEEPDKVYPDQIKLLSTKPLVYKMTSQHCVYTNNPHIVKKNIFMDYIFPHIKDGENLESQIDLVWHMCNLNIAVTEGLFTHNRIDGHTQCDCCAQRFGGKSDTCTWKCCPSTITGYLFF